MATESISTSLPTRPAKQAYIHPLAPISSTEIENAVALVKAQWPSGTDLHFKAITLEEPKKAEMVPFLEAEFAEAGSRRRLPGSAGTVSRHVSSTIGEMIITRRTQAGRGHKGAAV